jgi:hypothetical protein
MKKTYICKAIACPYFCNSVKTSYGCQFHSNAKSCHLLSGALSIQNTSLTTDYELIAINLTIDTALLKNENDAYIRESNRYVRDRKFQKLFPEDANSVSLPTRVL